MLRDHCLIVRLSVAARTVLVGTGQSLLEPLLLTLPGVEVGRVAHVVIHERVFDRLLFAFAVCCLTMKKEEHLNYAVKVFSYDHYLGHYP